MTQQLVPTRDEAYADVLDVLKDEYEQASKVYDEKYQTWKVLVDDPQYKAVLVAFDEAYAAWQAWRDRIEPVGLTVDDAHEVLSRAREAYDHARSVI